MSGTLVLVPSRLELTWGDSGLQRLSSSHHVQLCGVGPVLAAARVARLLANYQPQHVCLVGIAGSLSPQLELGQAYEFAEVACFGVGVGSGDEYRTATELGWSQWSKPTTAGVEHQLETTTEASDNSIVADDLSRIDAPLRLEHGAKHLPAAERLLLTVCAASASAHDVQLRLHKFPLAMAEDMEGYAVATACRLAQVPLRIVRGISNVAGDRRHEQWRAAKAMQAAVELLRATLT